MKSLDVGRGSLVQQRKGAVAQFWGCTHPHPISHCFAFSSTPPTHLCTPRLLAPLSQVRLLQLWVTGLLRGVKVRAGPC